MEEYVFWKCNYCGTLNQDSFACCQHCFKPKESKPETHEGQKEEQATGKQPSAYPAQRLIGWITDSVLIAAAAFAILLLVDTSSYDDTAIALSLQIAPIGYYLFFEWLLGATPGKLLAKTCVVRYKNGNKITFGQALLRTITRYLGIIDLGCYFIAGRTLHDLFSSTEVVVKKRKSDTL